MTIWHDTLAALTFWCLGIGMLSDVMVLWGDARAHGRTAVPVLSAADVSGAVDQATSYVVAPGCKIHENVVLSEENRPPSISSTTP